MNTEMSPTMVHWFNMGILLFAILLMVYFFNKASEKSLLKKKQENWDLKELAYSVQAEKDKNYISLLEQLAQVSIHEVGVSLGKNQKILIKFQGGEHSFQHYVRENGKWKQEYS